MAGGIGGGPEPTGTHGLWGKPGLQLPAGVQHITHALMAEGHPRSEAIAIAVGSLKRWSRGGGHVKPRTRALAVKGVARWYADRALAHGSHVIPPSAGRVSSPASARRDSQRTVAMARFARGR